MTKDLVQQINDILPQTQCKKCDYDGCLPYAQAIVNQEAPINQCPPGGQEGINRLGKLLSIDNTEDLTLNSNNGLEKPYLEVAVIDENICIGCTLCIKACPVDAILGAAKRMHSVIADECTGCELCIAPCPVDCITMINSSQIKTIDLKHSIKQEKRELAKYRYDNRNQRLESAQLEKEKLLKKRKVMLEKKSNSANSKANNDLIAQALARSQQRKQNLNK